MPSSAGPSIDGPYVHKQSRLHNEKAGDSFGIDGQSRNNENKGN